MRWILTLVAAVSLAGCSLFIQGPPSNPPYNEFPRCEEEVTMPTIDAAWAVLYIVTGGLIAASEPDDDGVVQGGLLVAGLGAVVFGGSAWHGFNKVRRCEQVRDAYRARYEEMQRGNVPPPPLQLGPPSSVPLAPPPAPAPAEPPPPPLQPRP